MRPCLHFVRFDGPNDQRLQGAVRVFGCPDFYHRLWDQRAKREIAAGDTIVFAKGDIDQAVTSFNGDDEAFQC